MQTCTSRPLTKYQHFVEANSMECLYTAEESSSVSQTESSNCFKLISAGSNVVLFSGCLMPVLSRAATIWHLIIGINRDPVIKERKSQQFFRQIPDVTQKFLNCNLCNYTIFLLVSVNSRSKWCLRCLKQDFDIQHYITIVNKQMSAILFSSLLST